MNTDYVEPSNGEDIEEPHVHVATQKLQWLQQLMSVPREGDWLEWLKPVRKGGGQYMN